MFKKNSNGFTLIELLVVIAIISILAIVVFINLSSAQKSSRDSVRKTDLQKIATALQSYYADNKNYPATFTPGPGHPASTDYLLASSALSSSLAPYIPSMPIDPANPPSGGYYYVSDGTQFKVVATVPERLVGVANAVDAQKIAGDFFDPNPAYFARFQVSSNSTAASW